MARDKHKYRRLSVDFTVEEYNRLRAATEGKQFMAAFVRDATMDRIDEPVHAVKHVVPQPPPRRKAAQG
jgi:hypothetical protein